MENNSENVLKCVDKTTGLMHIDHMTATQALNEIAKITGSSDKCEVITLAIGTLIKNGVETKNAFDAILGDGAYVKMAGMIYDELNK